MCVCVCTITHCVWNKLCSTLTVEEHSLIAAIVVGFTDLERERERER